jgi:predicted aspartyl protease
MRLALLPLLVLLLLVAFAGCEPPPTSRTHAPASAEAGEVPFRLAGPQDVALVVPVHINGQGTFDFIFDTGATSTCVDPRLAVQLGLPSEDDQMGLGTGIGGSRPIRIVDTDTVRVGPAASYGLPICVVDLAVLGDIDVVGLVGLNFIQDFLVTLDFQRNVLTLQRP